MVALGAAVGVVVPPLAPVAGATVVAVGALVVAVVAAAVVVVDDGAGVEPANERLTAALSPAASP